MKKLKICTIGGGSGYTPELIDGFIRRYKDLPVTDYYFLDIEEGREKLEIVGELAKRMVKKAGLDINIVLTTNREEALRDADFVTTQMRVGGADIRIHDERIPLSYGVLGQETNGPGGFMCALRTIPVLLDIAQDMEKLCPNAFMINFTNPAGIVTEALCKYSNIKNIGICSGANNMRRDIAKMYGTAYTDVELTIFGLNHLMFASKVLVNGIDKTHEVITSLAGNNIPGIAAENHVRCEFPSSFAASLGIFPLPGYLKYTYLNTETIAHLIEEMDTVGTRGQQTKQIEAELFEIYKNPNLEEKPIQLSKRGGSLYSDTAVSIICSIYNNSGDIHVANVPNATTTPDLETDDVIECNCIIDKDGAHPIPFGKIPRSIKGLIQQTKNYETLTVEAAVSGKYEDILLALANNPFVHSVKIAEEMLKDLLEINKKYMINSK